MKTLLLRSYGIYLNTLMRIAPDIAAEKAFAIFCRPFRTPLKPDHLAFLNASDRFDLMHERTRIQGYRWGNGSRRILFLHGWQSHTFRWKLYIEALLESGAYTIYAIDAPGHGQSEGKLLHVPLYGAVLNHTLEQIGPVDALVSHSMGAFAALYSLHTKPDSPVGKLVVMGVPGEATDFLYFFRDTLKLSPQVIEGVSGLFVKKVNKTPDYFSTGAFAKSLNIPGLIIHDTEDTNTPYHYAERLHQNWTGSRLITTTGLGHNLRSPEVVRNVVDFVQH